MGFSTAQVDDALLAEVLSNSRGKGLYKQPVEDFLNSGEKMRQFHPEGDVKPASLVTGIKAALAKSEHAAAKSIEVRTYEGNVYAIRMDLVNPTASADAPAEDAEPVAA